MMAVYYCEKCEHYFYISSNWYMNKCKICEKDIGKLPIEFVEFAEMTEEERTQYIKESIG